MDDDTRAPPPKSQGSHVRQGAAGTANTLSALAIILAATTLVSCSPKQALIPPDPHHWDELAKNVGRLSPEDSRLFAAYLSRRVMVDAFPDGRPNLPAGMTIGDAINDEKAFEARPAQRPASSPPPGSSI